MRYHFKQQPKIVLNITIALLIIGIISVFIKDSVMWGFMLCFCVILPAVFTVNIFSQEVENKTDFLVFTCRTPKYKILIQKYLSGWIMTETIAVGIYLLAFLFEMEGGFNRLLAILVYSTILSLIGLIVALISKKTMIGYGVAFGIWALQMLVSFSWTQKYSIISLIINLVITTTVWSNIMLLIAFVIPLFTIALIIVSKGEYVRKRIVILGSILSILVASLCYFTYSLNLKKCEFWKGTQWKSISCGEVNLNYRGISDNYADKISKITDSTCKGINKLFKGNICYNNLSICFGDDKSFVDNKEEVYKFNIYSLKAFEPSQSEGYDWPQKLSEVILGEHLKNIEDERLKDEWINYIFKMYIVPELKEKYGSMIWTKPYDYDIHEKESMIKKCNEVISKKKYEKFDSEIVARALLYNLDKMNHDEMIKVIKEINSSKKSLSNKDIKAICKKYFDTLKINELFACYEKANAITGNGDIIHYQEMK